MKTSAHLISSTNRQYIINNMSTEFSFDGLRVEFKDRVRDDVFSIYCVPLLEIISIEKIDDDREGVPGFEVFILFNRNLSCVDT